jgi:hypothetical protein
VDAAQVDFDWFWLQLVVAVAADRWAGSDAALMDFEVALVVAVAADELAVDAAQVDWLAVW